MASVKEQKHQAELMALIIERSGLSQNELAAMLGVHGQYVSNIKRGLSPIPPTWIYKLGKYATIREIESAAVKDFRVWWRRRAKKS